jgi:hypothetical protein
MGELGRHGRVCSKRIDIGEKVVYGGLLKAWSVDLLKSFRGGRYLESRSLRNLGDGL